MKNNIFLIDDDKNILTSVSMLLESEGYKVKTFSDGESGLKAILENHPDIEKGGGLIPESLHESRPVIKGEKWALVIWSRIGKYIYNNRGNKK